MHLVAKLLHDWELSRDHTGEITDGILELSARIIIAKTFAKDGLDARVVGGNQRWRGIMHSGSSRPCSGSEQHTLLTNSHQELDCMEKNAGLDP